MLRLRAVSAAACVLALAGVALNAVPATAADAPSEGAIAAALAAPPAQASPTEPGLVAALQRDLGLTPQATEARLANESRAAAQQIALQGAFGAAWAGAWVVGDDARLVVASTDPAQVKAVNARGGKAQLARYSLAQLDAVKAKLDRRAEQATPAGTPLWYVDAVTNKVVVQSADAARTAAFLKSAGVDRSTVEVVAATVSPRALADLRGGDAYNIGNSSRCSVGFPVTKGTQQGFVTAGHCGDPGNTTSAGGVAQGTFQGSSFPGNDYAWVLANSNWVATPKVNNYAGGTVTVAGSTQAAVGSSVCRSGSTTGWHCGTIQQYNASVTYPEGTITGLGRTTVCAEPGDSGGSYISGSQAQGVTSGGSGNCTSGGETYFQPVNEILQVYGLTLKTSGGTDPEPPTGCAGSQNSYTGSLSSGATAVQPNGSYYYSASSGTHVGCLAGPSGADFDLYLQKWNGSAWVDVASGTTAAAGENVSYSGTAGYYRYVVHAYSGSGSYILGVTKP